MKDTALLGSRLFKGSRDGFQNPFGNARPENFPLVNDYRNPLLSSAMKNLGYVNKYNRGIGQVRDELEANGNPPAEYKVDMLTAFAVEIKKGTSPNVKGHKSEEIAGTSQSQKGHKSEATMGTSRSTKGRNSETVTDYNEKHRPFGSSILTLRERIVMFCETPRSMAEIVDFLGVKDKRKARERYIDPQLGITLERTVPDKPTSRLQKYVAKKL